MEPEGDVTAVKVALILAIAAISVLSTVLGFVFFFFALDALAETKSVGKALISTGFGAAIGAITLSLLLPNWGAKSKAAAEGNALEVLTACVCLIASAASAPPTAEDPHHARQPDTVEDTTATS